MSDKLYTCLLRLYRLYPSGFRKQYEGEALQLIRDRLREETGFFKRTRLCWDLIADVVTGLPQAYLNSYAMPEAASLSPQVDGIPSFKVLDSQPLSRGSILIGVTLSMLALAAFGFVLSRPIFYQSNASTNGQVSPIESVIQRLNRDLDPASLTTAPRTDAKSHSPETSNQAAASATPSNQNQSAPPATPPIASNSRDRAIPIQVPSPNGRSVASPTTQTASAATPQRVVLRKAIVTATPAPNRSTAPVRGATQASSIAPKSTLTPAPANQPRLDNANKAMIELFRNHDIVMFGEVHGSQQEYEWLCNLVKTPGFADHVDDIVVEFGNARYQKTVDRYIAGENVSFDQVQQAWRNMVADAEPVSPVYGWFYKAIREANLEHPGKRGIRLLMGSPAADWSKIKNSADLAPFENNREQWYTDVVKREVLAQHRHALLIMGAGHFIRGHDQALQFELAAQQHHDVPLDKTHLGLGYIERELRAAGANPYLVVFGTNAIDNRGNVDSRFDSFPVPVIAPLSGNWIGALPAQPVISGGHASAIPLTLADQADALLYVAPCRALRTVHLSQAELDGTPYKQEVTRRDLILVGHLLTFPYGVVPQCAQP